MYRPNDLFRIKVLGMFPRVSEDCLIPYEWIEIANRRWQEYQEEGFQSERAPLIGVDVAGMGRDDSVLCPRYGNYVPKYIIHQSGGRADHMHIVGLVKQAMIKKGSRAFIDTIGEGAGVYSRLIEQGVKNVNSCKFSEGARNLHDITGQYSFANMRAYLYWAVRDWLNPKNGFMPALPPDDKFMEEATAIKWKFQSDGTIYIEAKEDIKKKIKRSTDRIDALANTFYPKGFGLSDDDLLKVFA